MKITRFQNYKIFDSIVEKVHGWTPEDQLLSLFNTAISTKLIKNADILEVGSWCGRSAIALSSAAKLIDCKVYAVDLFPKKDDWYINPDNNASFKTNVDGESISGYTDQRVWPEAFRYLIDGYRYHRNEDLLKIFKKNIQSFKLSKYTIPFRGTLEEFLKKNKKQFRLIFLDGDHSYKGVKKEIRLLKKYLKKGGWICFDDAFTVYMGVNKAIREELLKDKKFSNFTQITRKMFIAQKIK